MTLTPNQEMLSVLDNIFQEGLAYRPTFQHATLKILAAQLAYMQGIGIGRIGSYAIEAGNGTIYRIQHRIQQRTIAGLLTTCTGPYEFCAVYLMNELRKVFPT